MSVDNTVERVDDVCEILSTHNNNNILLSHLVFTVTGISIPFASSLLTGILSTDVTKRVKRKEKMFEDMFDTRTYCKYKVTRKNEDTKER